MEDWQNVSKGVFYHQVEIHNSKLYIDEYTGLDIIPDTSLNGQYDDGQEISVSWAGYKFKDTTLGDFAIVSVMDGQRSPFQLFTADTIYCDVVVSGNGILTIYNPGWRTPVRRLKVNKGFSITYLPKCILCWQGINKLKFINFCSPPFDSKKIIEINPGDNMSPKEFWDKYQKEK